jgi:hypothetical protein
VSAIKPRSLDTVFPPSRESEHYISARIVNFLADQEQTVTEIQPPKYKQEAVQQPHCTFGLYPEKVLPCTAVSAPNYAKLEFETYHFPR